MKKQFNSIVKNKYSKALLIILILAGSLTGILLYFNSTEHYWYDSLPYHEPLIILSDSDFLKYNFPGDGSPSNPYRIESLKIINDTFNAITIEDTTAYFIIQNCFFSSNDSRVESIELNRIANNTAIIRNNLIYGEASRYSFDIRYSPYVQIYNNTFENSLGSRIFHSPSTRITNNIFRNSSFRVEYCSDSIISQNSFSMVCWLHTYYSNNITISNNSLHGSISIRHCPNFTLTNNILDENYISINLALISEYYSVTISNNSISNLPYGFFLNMSNMIILDSFAMFLMIDCENITVLDQYIDDKSSGFELLNCVNCSIKNCLIKNSETAIQITDSYSMLIENVQMYNNRFCGIFVSSSPCITIKDCVISGNCLNCMRISGAANSTFVNNTLSDSTKDAIYFSGIDCSRIIDNTFFQSSMWFVGLTLDNLRTLTIQGNIVNSKPYGMFLDRNNFTISDEYGQLYIRNCTDFKIIGQDITVNGNSIHITDSKDFQIQDNRLSGYIINDLYRFDGLMIRDCNNFMIKDNFLTKKLQGIYISDSNYSMVVNNHLEEVNQGIIVYDSSMVDIENNEIKGEEVGICLSNSLMLNVSNNSVKNLDEGLGIYDCFNTSILNNSFSYSSECGVFISSNIGGIIQSNFVSYNKIGIILRGSSFNVLTYNIIQENELHGIQINNIQHYSDTKNSTNNTLYQNYFISNNQGGKSQAYDEGINNTWHNPSSLVGNSWSDLTGEGAYSIDGSSNSFDPYPSTVPPEIISTDKSSYPYFLTQIVLYLTLYKLIKNRKLRIKKIKFC